MSSQNPAFPATSEEYSSGEKRLGCRKPSGTLRLTRFSFGISESVVDVDLRKNEVLSPDDPAPVGLFAVLLP